MRFASLGSGSRGNGLLVEAGATRILVDCGFPLRDAAARLARLGLAPGDVSAIVVTHEHSDHIGGVFRLASRYAIPVWMTHGTRSAVAGRADVLRVEVFDSHAPFHIGDLQVLPFPVPHDAREPVQFVFSEGCTRLGVLTDIGETTPHVEAMLSGCHGLVLECNHDAQLLRDGDYPPALKRRIAGRYGHLENQAAARLLARLDTRRLQHLIAAHLSQQNNTADRARAALAAVLGCAAEWIGVADQDRGLDWRSLA
jgi:phosphoribosyl 1,2-cyclic phosphodiesterase